MKKAFFPGLAITNLRKNAKFYVPYILTVVGTVASFYILTALASDKAMEQLRGADYIGIVSGLGMFVAGIFSVIFLMYTNSFLMKRRHREFGLYNILGMGKGHIACILCLESLYVALIGIVFGLFAGILLHKLVTLILHKILHFDVPFGFRISFTAITVCAVFFSAIILLTLLINLHKIRISKPIELLRSSSEGEREPKTKLFLAIIGIVTLTAGYCIAVTVKDPINALLFYFVAVFLVIIGTYCLFTSVSILLLKFLRRIKCIYYKTDGFIGISGMLYRMKQNAVGLANICILSTMVLVMVSGTLSLYLGTDEVINSRYPAEIMPTVYFTPDCEPHFDRNLLIEKINGTLSKEGCAAIRFDSYEYLSFAVGVKDKNNGIFTTERDSYDVKSITELYIFTAEEYAKLSGSSVSLSDNEILFYSDAIKPKNEFLIQSSGGNTLKYTINKTLTEFPVLQNTVSTADRCFITVKDDDTLRRLYDFNLAAYGEHAGSMKWEAFIDLDSPKNVKDKTAQEIALKMSALEGFGGFDRYKIETRAESAADLYASSGGFLFLGVFLGLIFTMATALIIYYKQISEGYDDKARYEIMQKVGLTQKEIKRSIRSQILIVFFAPLAVAALHIAFNFNMVIKLLTLFSLHNESLTLFCTIGTLLGFTLVYGTVYILTAKTYYRIVKQ